MKRMFRNKFLFAGSMLIAATLSSCSDSFLEDKKNYDNTTSEIYDYYSGANARLSDLYQACMPNIQAVRGWQFPSMGYADEQSQMTEEYSGFSIFVDPQKDVNTITGTAECPEYFQGTSAYSLNASPWGVIRNINDCIQGIEAGSLSAAEKDELLGQAYFLRAWRYYYLVRYYGGVPIIKTTMDASSGSVVPRSSAKECIKFVIEDLDRAAEMLKKRTVESSWSASDWGRITTGAALALKGRVMLMWASPLFNRDNDMQRWKDAYEFMKEALPVINSCGYGLAYENEPGVNGSGWAKMFLDITNNPEAVFATMYNKNVPDLTPDYQRNNIWEQGARPANTLGNNGKNPSAMIVDLFPMKDGKRPASYNSYTKLESSSVAYDAEHPFMNRDPRFYRTFAFPGVYWRFKGDPNTSKSCNPYTGDKYILWNYVWYNDAAKLNDAASSDCYGADNLLGSAKGMYVRKFSDDLDVNSTPNYEFNTEGKSIGFRCCMTSTMEIRYAEVLLNYAEAACMTGNMPEAVTQLQRIRRRAGYTAADNYGLPAGIESDQQACMSAILYERQIEFAFEGKRSEDMRRWLLFDGGANFASIGAKPLTGWGGNTCTWLGIAPLVGQRRENMEFRLKDELNYTDGTSGRTWALSSAVPAEREKDNPDPLLGGSKPKLTRADRDAYALDLKGDIEAGQNKLKEFYDSYLVRKTKKGDGYDSNNTQLNMTWNPRYYFYGLTKSAQINNSTLLQTVGWEDYQNGGANGTFDPLSDTLPE